MANDNEIALDLKIKTAESAATVKELKASLKDLVNELDKVPEGSAGFKKLQNSINETEGKIGDLNDQFSTLRGSGVERLNSSVGMLSEGFTSFDTGKISAGFKGLGAAMSAIPIFLIIEGLKLLWENFDVVVNIAKSFTSAAKEQAATLRDLNVVMNEVSANLDEIAFKEKEYSRNRQAQNNIDIENAKQRGATEKEINQMILKDKEENLALVTKVETNYRNQKIAAEAQYLIALKSGDEKVVEQAKAVFNRADSLHKSSIDKRKEANIQYELDKEKLETEQHTKSVEAYKKQLADKKTAEEKHLNDLYQMHLNEVAQFNQKHIDEAAAEKEQKRQELIGLNQSVLDAELEYQNDSFVQEQKANSDKEFAEALSLERRKEGYKQLQASQLNLTKQSLQAVQALTDLYFNHQLRQVKGNADKEREIKKKAFNVNKAFGVANAVIDGVGAVQKALNNPYPLNIVLAVLSGVLAAANVAKIASAKFDDGGGSSGSAGDIGGGNISAPVIPQPNNTSTKLNDNGKVQGQATGNQQPIIIKNEIVETQITEKQERVQKIKESATYG